MISDNKLKHSIAVARTCVEKGKELNLSEAELDACFVMGFLHDIGYEKINSDITKHPQKSYEMICNAQEYRTDILNAIKNHGRCNNEKMTKFDYILNYADLTVDHKGEHVSIDKRVKSIGKWHGEMSEHYIHAKEQADSIYVYEKKNKIEDNDFHTQEYMKAVKHSKIQNSITI